MFHYLEHELVNIIEVASEVSGLHKPLFLHIKERSNWMAANDTEKDQLNCYYYAKKNWEFIETERIVHVLSKF